MKTNPRIGGSWWPVFLVLILVLLLPIGLKAQEAGGGPDEGGGTDAVNQESTAGEESVVTAEGAGITQSSDGITVVEMPTSITMEEMLVPDFDFVMPGNIRVVDWPSDSGGKIAVIWGPSESDQTGGEEEPTPGGQYMVYESGVGPDGPWTEFDEFLSNERYTWEDPATFGFFLSELRHGKNEHYSRFEKTYPTTGIFFYGVSPVEGQPGSYRVYTQVYDSNLDNYQNVNVFVDLAPLLGEKTQLMYEPPEPGVEPLPWENTFSATVQLDQLSIPMEQSRLLTTTSYFILFSADIRGQRTGVLEIQPSMNPEGLIVVDSTGGEPEVQDNRDPHWFRVYAAPVGYMVPEGQELPPDEWLVGASEQIIAKGNAWNAARTNTFIWAIFICTAVLSFIFKARKGATLFVRRIAGLDHVDEAIGRATEMGRPILYTTGLGGVSDIATIASMNILGRVARKAADYESRIMVPNRDPIVMAVCQEVVQEAYIDAGRPDAFNRDDVFFVTDDQFAYTAAVDGIMMREKPATNFFMGLFFAESLLLAETGSSTGAVQIAGTDALAQLPFFITACDYTLIGEELYAASAYLSHEPLLLGSLKGQDLSKLVFMIAVLVGTIWLCLGAIPNLPLPNPEFFKQLFQAF